MEMAGDPYIEVTPPRRGRLVTRVAEGTGVSPVVCVACAARGWMRGWRRIAAVGGGDATRRRAAASRAVMWRVAYECPCVDG